MSFVTFEISWKKAKSLSYDVDSDVLNVGFSIL